MGVILCDSPTGPFSVVVIPKCGSTTVRVMLADIAKPGQYIIPPRKRLKVQKMDGWHVATRYRGEHRRRSWGVLRNPWGRLVSRWRERHLQRTEPGAKTWPEYVRTIRHGRGSGTPPTKMSAVARDQSWFLGTVHPQKLVTIEDIAIWMPELAAAEGVTLGVVVHARSYGAYDWRQHYRDHPETRDIVREVFAADWELGLEWEDPLA